MSAELAQDRMTVEEFLAWTDARNDEARFELDDGEIVAMAPERIVHARAKFAIARTLADSVAKAGLPCEVFVEGPGVRIDAHTSYEPDVIVQCGPRLSGEVRFVDKPVVIVEILSSSTAYRDLGRKARNYFRVGSVAHYLIVDPNDRVVSHRWRGDAGVILSEDLLEGDLTLDPPGLRVAVSAFLPLPESENP
jgi:Uma2 family endonuclease